MIDVKDVCVRLRHSVHEKGLGDNEHRAMSIIHANVFS